MTSTDVGLSAPPHESVVQDARAVALVLAASLVLLACYASFMVPLLRAGLAGAPMVTFGDPASGAAVFLVGGTPVADVPGLAHELSGLWFATIALGPLLAAAGAGVGGYVAAHAVRGRRPVRAAASALTCLVCVGVLALALSPWGRTAKVWLLD